MADAIVTQTPDQLPRATDAPTGALLIVQQPGGPVQAIDLGTLFKEVSHVDAVSATVALLPLTFDAGAIALVYAEPAPGKSGYYTKTGDNGTGSWEFSNFVESAAAADLSTYVDQAQQAASDAEAAKTAMTAAFSFTTRFGFPALCTADGRILLYADPKTGAINFLPDPQLVAKLSADPSFDSSQGNAGRLLLRTADGRAIAIWDEAGLFDTKVSPAFVARLYDALDPAIFAPESTDFSRLYMWGDSRTEGAGDAAPNTFPNYAITALPGVAVFGKNDQSLGRSGQTSLEIAARQGGRPAILTVTGDTIPASGAVAITSYSTNIFFYGSAQWSTWDFFNSQTGTLAGVHGTYATDTSGNQTFTRDEAGDAVTVPPGSCFVPDIALQARSGMNFQCVGTNDGYTDLDGIVANSVASRQYCEAGGGLMMTASVIGRKRGSAGDTNQSDIIALNNKLRTAHGRYYLDFLTPPSAAEMAAVGYTPTDDDNADIAAGYWPGGLYGDGTHFIGAGQHIQVNRMVALFTTLKASH